MLACGEQLSRALEPALDSELMRREAEHRFELPDEMERRDLHLSRHLVDRQGTIVRFLKKVARADEAREDVMPQ